MKIKVSEVFIKLNLVREEIKQTENANQKAEGLESKRDALIELLRSCRAEIEVPKHMEQILSPS